MSEERNILGTTYLVVRRHNFIPDVEFAVLQAPGMKNITTIHLNISHVEVCDAIYYNVARVILLAA